jgi:wyosine [tRNA(Phe)-imidazoG37] synthetase (radical SAM superfamily)
MGRLLRRVRQLTDLPLAVITNGSLLREAAVREELSVADAVLPSLDAGSARLFRDINRPAGRFGYDRHVSGLAGFAADFEGRFWLEVMLVRDLNDTESALHDLARAVEQIGPDEVHLLTPSRPPAEKWVRPPGREGLMRAAAILGRSARVVEPAEVQLDLTAAANPLTAILSVIARHPMSHDALLATLERCPRVDAGALLCQLERSGQARRVKRLGVDFWIAPQAHFP